jgi:hypothetical protein
MKYGIDVFHRARETVGVSHVSSKEPTAIVVEFRLE